MSTIPLLRTDNILYGGRDENNNFVIGHAQVLADTAAQDQAHIVGDIELRMLTMSYLVHVHSLLFSESRVASSYDDGQIKSWQETTRILQEYTRPGEDHCSHWRAILLAGGSKKIITSRGSKQSQKLVRLASSSSASLSSTSSAAQTSRHRRLFFVGIIGIGIKHEPSGSQSLRGGILVRPELQTLGIGSDAIHMLLNQYIIEHKQDPRFGYPLVLRTSVYTPWELPAWDSHSPVGYKNPAVLEIFHKLRLTADPDRVLDGSKAFIYWKSKIQGHLCGLFQLYNDLLASDTIPVSLAPSAHAGADETEPDSRNREAALLVMHPSQFKKLNIPLDQVSNSPTGVLPWESLVWSHLVQPRDQAVSVPTSLEQDRVFVLKGLIPDSFLAHSDLIENSLMTVFCLQGCISRQRTQDVLTLEFIRDSSESHTAGTPDKYFSNVAFQIGMNHSELLTKEQRMHFMVSRGLRGPNLDHGSLTATLIVLDGRNHKWYKVLASTLAFQNITKKRVNQIYISKKRKRQMSTTNDVDVGRGSGDSSSRSPFARPGQIEGGGPANQYNPSINELSDPLNALLDDDIIREFLESEPLEKPPSDAGNQR